MTNYSQRYAAGDSNTAGAFYFDTISAVDYPASKVLWGAEGAVNHASAATPLPVTAVITGDALTSLQLIDNAISGAGFNITQFAGASVPIGAGVEATALRVTLATDSTGVISVDDNGGSLTVDGTVAATQSGTWNITNISGTVSLPTGAATAAKQPALGTAGTASSDVITVQGIASMTALKVDGSAVTQPVSDAGGTLSVDDGGGSLTVDGTVSVSGTVTVGSHAVTNAGTFAVQVDGSALTALQLIDDYVFADDAAFTLASSKVAMVGAIRDDSLSTLTAVEGDAVPLRVSSTGALHVTGGGGGTEYNEGDTDASITGSAILWEDTGDTLRAVSAAKPLPIGDAGGSLTVDGSLTSVTTVSTVTSLSQFAGQAITLGAGAVAAGTLRTTLASDDPAVTSLSTLTAVDYMLGTDFSNVFGTASLIIATQADNTANTQDTIATSALGYVFDGTTWDRMRGDSTDGLLVNLGSNNDVTVTSGNIIVDSITGTVTVGTHAVTQSGTWNIGTVTTLTGTTTLTPGTGATNLGKAIDTAAGATDTGVAVLAVRDDALSSLTPIEGDYVPMRTDANGALWVIPSGTVTVTGTGGTFPVTDSGGTLTVDDGGTTLSIDDGGGNISIDDGGNSITVDGTITATIAAGATTIAKAEDVASADADVGVPAMAVRKATPANTSGTDGDYEFLQMSAGRLWASVVVDTALPAGTNAIGKLAANSGVDIGDVDVTSVVPGTGATNLGKAEDAAHTTGDVGVMALSVRQDTAAALGGTDADYQPLITDANGRLHTIAAIAASQTLATVTTVTTVSTLTGGGVAHDAADSGNPIKVGARATASLAGATMVAAADRSDLICGTDGALIVRTGYSLEDVVQERTTNTDGASTAFSSGLGAPGSGVRLWITGVTIANSSASFCTVDLRDGSAGSVLWTLPVPATGGVTWRFDPPLKLTANTALAFDASAAISTLSISANGFKSKV